MSRIDEALMQWDERQTKYVDRYGKDLLKDREFAKVKLKALKRALEETKGLRLTNEEKDDKNVLKAQINKLEKEITPNQILRVTKRLAEKSKKIGINIWNKILLIQQKLQKNREDPYPENVLGSVDPDFSKESQQQDQKKQTKPGSNKTQNHSQQNRLQARTNETEQSKGSLIKNLIAIKHNRKPRAIAAHSSKGIKR